MSIYDHQLASKAYLSDATGTNIAESFTYKMAGGENQLT